MPRPTTRSGTAPWASAWSTSPGPAEPEVAAALALTSPFVPMLFQGEEWAASTPFQYFTDHSDPELARAIQEGRRSEFAALVSDESTVPDPQDSETFAASKLDWDERPRSEHRAMLEWHRSLITLRRSVPDLTSASEEATGVTFDEEGRWIVVRRGSIDVAVNLGDTAQWVPVVTEGAVVLLSNDPDPDLGPAGVRVEPDGVVLIGPAGGEELIVPRFSVGSNG